jgi:hypothetical protein
MLQQDQFKQLFLQGELNFEIYKVRASLYLLNGGRLPTWRGLHFSEEFSLKLLAYFCLCFTNILFITNVKSDFNEGLLVFPLLTSHEEIIDVTNGKPIVHKLQSNSDVKALPWSSHLLWRLQEKRNRCYCINVDII